jgi:acetyl-CoA decarbonylase/synthase complex subunit epsilon
MSATIWKLGDCPAGGHISVKIDGKVAGRMIKEAKNPLLIIGKLACEVDLGEKRLVDYAIEMTKKGIPTVASAGSSKEYPADLDISMMGAVEIVNRLQNPKYGLNGKPHDLVITMGIQYYLASQSLATLKHFAPHLKTLALCARSHPNATWAFPYMPDYKWKEEMDILMENL